MSVSSIGSTPAVSSLAKPLTDADGDHDGDKGVESPATKVAEAAQAPKPPSESQRGQAVDTHV